MTEVEFAPKPDESPPAQKLDETEPAQKVGHQRGRNWQTKPQTGPKPAWNGDLRTCRPESQ